MAGKATLAEIMGPRGAQSSKDRKLTMKDLPDLLGEGMPELQFNQVGRIRLMRALKQRFGASFRNIPGVSDIVRDFDDESRFSLDVKRMKQIRSK